MSSKSKRSKGSSSDQDPANSESSNNSESINTTTENNIQNNTQNNTQNKKTKKITKKQQNKVLELENKNRKKFRSRKNIPRIDGPIAEKLTKQQEKLLEIYYHQQDECDHIWIDHPMRYIGFNHETKTSAPYAENFTEITQTIQRFDHNDQKALIVHIDSGGGDMDGGLMLHNLLKTLNKPVITVVEYSCASAAVDIFLAGDLRIIKPYVLFLIHQHSRHEYGRFKELRRHTYADQMIYEKTNHLYLKGTKLDKKTLKKIVRVERYLTNSELIKYGITDHIFDSKKVPRLNIDIKSAIPREITLNDMIRYKKEITSQKFYIENKISKFVLTFDYAQIGYLYSLFFINRVLEIPIEFTCVIPVAISSGKFLLSLFMDHSTLVGTTTTIGFDVSKILFQGFPSDDASLEDNSSNTIFVRKMIINIIKSRTKLPKKIIDEIPYKQFDFTAEESLKYGLVSDILYNKYRRDIK